MNIKIIYSKSQLDATVNFIIKNNKYLMSNKNYNNKNLLSKKILSCMNDLASDSEINYISTLGFILIPEREYESMDCDENLCRIEIFVDPSVSHQFTESDYIETIIEC